MATDVTIPPLGESITEAGVGQWLKQPGDPVKADEPIVSLETDKVAVEIPSPIDGVMGEQLAKVGDTVAVGTVIARIEVALQKITRDADIVRSMESRGADVGFLNAQLMGAFMSADAAKWKRDASFAKIALG